MPPTRTLPPLPHRDDIAPQKAVKQCAGKCRIRPADGDKLQRQPSPPPLIHISPRTYSRSCNVITRMRSSCMPACHGEKELQNRTPLCFRILFFYIKRPRACYLGARGWRNCALESDAHVRAMLAFSCNIAPSSGLFTSPHFLAPTLVQ